MGIRGLVEVAWWWIHGHGRLKNCGPVILACTGVPSVYRRLSQKYQTNRNNKWSLYAVMMVQVRVGDGDSGVAGSDLMRFQTPPWSKLPSRASHKTPTIG